MKIFFGVLGSLIVLFLLGLLLSFIFGWGQKAADTVGPENVNKQYDLVIQNWNALTTAADNACAVTEKEGGVNSPTFVESPAQAYIATYRNIRTEYNSAQENIFDAKLVGPSGYPEFVPNFPEATGAAPDFCSVSTQLANLQASN
jgi:hypothetical protein